MPQDRPKLTDPQEWAIVHKMYFGGMERPWNEEIDPLERLDRMESKHTTNQAR